MADPNLQYKSIASARTEAQEEDQDEVPIRDFMPMPYENIINLVRKDLKISEDRFSNEDLEQFVKKQNEKAWTENLKNVTAQPVVRSGQYMRQTYQWECKRLAGFPRVEKTARTPKANVGTLLNIYSVVQTFPPPIWKALTGRDDDITEMKAAELGALTKDQLNNTEWTNDYEETENKIIWTFTRGPPSDDDAPTPKKIPVKIPTKVTVAKATVKSAVPETKKIGVDLEILEDRKFGAYLDKPTDINDDFRQIATSKALHFSQIKLGTEFPSVLNEDDFNLVGGIETSREKYDFSILQCVQIIFNKFREKGLTLTNQFPDLANLSVCMRGRRFQDGTKERYQNVLSSKAQAVFKDDSLIDQSLDEKDERNRVHGQQLWVVDDDKVVGLLWVKNYDETLWHEWFVREFNTNIDTANLPEGFRAKLSTPPFSDDASIKERIDPLLDSANGLYFEVCHVDGEPGLSLMLNLLGMILYGSEKHFAVSNIAPALPSEDGNYDTSLWKNDKYGPRLVPDPSYVYDQERYLGFQKSFDLRMNTMKMEAKEPTVSLNRLYHLEGDLPDSFNLPPVFRLFPPAEIPRKAKSKPGQLYLDLCDLLWQDDYMFYNDTWQTGNAINKQDSILRGLSKLAAGERLYADYEGPEPIKSNRWEYQIYRPAALTPVEAYERSNYDHERIEKGATSANAAADDKNKLRWSKFRNNTLSPRLLHYEMVRFIPNLKEIRTMCVLLSDYKQALAPEIKFSKSPSKSVNGGIRGGSVCSRTSDMSELIRRLKDDELVAGSLEPVVEMEVDIGVEAGFSSEME